MFGSNVTVDQLRVITAIELYLNADFHTGKFRCVLQENLDYFSSR